MDSDEREHLVEIECYDAFGYYEENMERIVLVMKALANTLLKKRDWRRAQAVGGSWARALSFTFETSAEPIQVKEWMIGLEYRPIIDVPKKLQDRPEKPGLFRFADIDVIEMSGGVKRGALRRLSSRIGLGGHKIEKAEISNRGRQPEFIFECRQKLLTRLDTDTRQRLLDIEQKILEKIAEPLSSRS